MKLIDVVLAAMFLAIVTSPASAAATCENLSSLFLPDTTITMARTVAAGALTLPTPLPAAGPRGDGET